MLNADFHHDSHIRIDNKRVAGIVLKDDSLLLMYRNKKGREFYAFPGGHMQEGENETATLKREIQEETSLSVKDITPAFTLTDHVKNKVDYYYTATWESGDAVLGGEESEKNSPENLYKLEWIKLTAIDNLNILPKAPKEWVQETLT